MNTNTSNYMKLSQKSHDEQRGYCRFVYIAPSSHELIVYCMDLVSSLI